jgi:hypothetical protein
MTSPLTGRYLAESASTKSEPQNPTYSDDGWRRKQGRSKAKFSQKRHASRAPIV